MKKTPFKFFASVVALAALLLVSSDSFGQTRGSTVQTKPTEGTGITSVTKVYEFNSGGIAISPLRGDVTYTVYERPSTGSTIWTKTDSGTLTTSDGRGVEICKTAAALVKVEIKLLCETCGEVRVIDCRN